MSKRRTRSTTGRLPVNRKLVFDEEDDSFVISSQEEEEEEEEEEKNLKAPRKAARGLARVGNLENDLKILTALNDTYRTHPTRNLAIRIQGVLDRIEPPHQDEEEEEEEEEHLDAIINIPDRIHMIHPAFVGDVPREVLFEIGRLARIHHLKEYKVAPTKVARIIDGRTQFVNVYTEETAPKTVDRAIREFFNL